MANTVSVEKVGNEIFFKTAPVFQYNEGNQYLELIGFDLPSSYRVDFSNYIDSQQSISMIGGTAGVVIPSELLATGSTVYAFYVDVDSDATTTLYRIEIPVVRRPEPSDREPSPEEQSAISQLMNDVGDLKSDLGDLDDLQTTAKNNLVAAINEARQSGGGGGSGSGGIAVVSLASEMTNTSSVYLYNGTETGYTAGHWYFYNTGTSTWTDGGQYTGWETVDTALENFLDENAQEMGTLTVTVGDIAYTYNGSSNIAITLPIYDGGVS